MKKIMGITVLIILTTHTASRAYFFDRATKLACMLSGLAVGYSRKDKILYQQPPTLNKYGEQQIFEKPIICYQKERLNRSILEKNIKYTAFKTEQVGRLYPFWARLTNLVPWCKPYGTLKDKLEKNVTSVGYVVYQYTTDEFPPAPAEIKAFKVPGPFEHNDEKLTIAMNLLGHVCQDICALKDRKQIIFTCSDAIEKDKILQRALLNNGFYKEAHGYNRCEYGENVWW